MAQRSDVSPLWLRVAAVACTASGVGAAAQPPARRTMALLQTGGQVNRTQASSPRTARLAAGEGLGVSGHRRGANVEHLAAGREGSLFQAAASDTGSGAAGTAADLASGSRIALGLRADVTLEETVKCCMYVSLFSIAALVLFTVYRVFFHSEAVFEAAALVATSQLVIVVLGMISLLLASVYPLALPWCIVALGTAANMYIHNRLANERK
mmetsp:Transcript_95098/g.268633  ORF Transcript_95098/g.268633 Transcript_95098/m.268633 type:complete len:211 (-) Transcript_95098:71-703(-)